MSILFIGGIFHNDNIESIKLNSIGNIQNAANALQWGILKGLNENNEKVSVINSVFIGSYPFFYRKIIIPATQFENDWININDTAFINIFLLKHLSKYISLKKEVKKWLVDSDEYVIAYSLNIVFLLILRYIKLTNKSIKTCIIVPDLPEYMNTNAKQSYIYKVMKALEIKLIHLNIKYVDNYIVLTEQMAVKMQLEKPFTVIEGIYLDSIYNGKGINTDKIKKNIVYTGTLNEKYGVKDLIKAFMMIKDPNIQLIICGEGDCKDFLIKNCKVDNRIVYLGLQNRDKILELQQTATLLINPRKNVEEFCKYSFPSKLIEYLSSGTPTIAYRLDGVPKEYDEYIIYPSDNSVSSLADIIEEYIQKDTDTLNYIGKRAKNFIVQHKNAKIQTKKILNLLYNQI